MGFAARQCQCSTSAVSPNTDQNCGSGLARESGASVTEEGADLPSSRASPFPHLTCIPRLEWGLPPANASAAPRSSALTPIKTVGAGLLAKAVCQSLKRVADLSPSRASPLPHLTCIPRLEWGLPPANASAAPRPSALTPIKTVGAGLPAKAVYQSLKRVADLPSSRASPLTHLGCISRLEPSCAFSSNAVQHLGLQPEHRPKLWERACSRKRCVSR